MSYSVEFTLDATVELEALTPTIQGEHPIFAILLSRGAETFVCPNFGLCAYKNGMLPIQERILRKVRWLLDNFENMNHQALSANLSGLFKLRVGDYRVIYSFIVTEKRIIIHKVGHRRSIYN